MYQYIVICDGHTLVHLPFQIYESSCMNFSYPAILVCISWPLPHCPINAHWCLSQLLQRTCILCLDASHVQIIVGEQCTASKHCGGIKVGNGKFSLLGSYTLSHSGKLCTNNVDVGF